jgi:hypothetical protein
MGRARQRYSGTCTPTFVVWCELHSARKLEAGVFAVAAVVASLLPAPRLRRSPPACPRTVRLRRCRSSPGSSPIGVPKEPELKSKAGGEGLAARFCFVSEMEARGAADGIRRLLRGCGRRCAPSCATAAVLPARLPELSGFVAVAPLRTVRPSDRPPRDYWLGGMVSKVRLAQVTGLVAGAFGSGAWVPVWEACCWVARH